VWRLYFLFALALCRVSAVFGQQNLPPPIKKDTLKEKQRLIVTPLAFFTPETNFGGGIAGIYYIYPKSTLENPRPHSLSFIGAYTVENQIIAQAPFQLYFKDEKYWIFGEAAYFRFPYRFFGVGNDIDYDISQRYEASFIRVQTQALHKIITGLYAGLNLRYDHYFNIEFDTTQTIINDDIPGFEPAVSSGLGLTTIYDNRDNVFSATKGFYLNVRYTLFRDFFGSDFKFSNVILDFRKYVKLKKKNSLAFQIYQQFSNGEVPFHQLSQIGGSSRMRGYLEGAYRDANMTIIQAEYRQMVWRRFGFVAFGSLGEIYESGGFFKFENVLPSYGLGIRYELDREQRIRFRFDYGMGKTLDIRGFYFTFNEAF
jgi:outer membrane protein assembly factor BamA